MKYLIGTIAVIGLFSAPAYAEHDHAKKEAAELTQTDMQDHSAHEMKSGDQNSMDHGKMDHGNMDHGNMDHSNMDHGNMDHSKMNHGDGHMMGSKTMPADGAILDTAPRKIGVNFGHKMNVEAVIISTFTGEMIEMDISEIGETDHFMLDAPELQADDYIVDWRARGSDGHIMSGSFAFTIE